MGRFCTKCGTPTVEYIETMDNSQIAQGFEGADNSQIAQGFEGAKQPKKKKKGPIIAIIIATLLIVAAIAAATIWYLSKDKAASLDGFKTEETSEKKDKDEDTSDSTNPGKEDAGPEDDGPEDDGPQNGGMEALEPITRFDDSIGRSCSSDKTMDNNIASFEYELDDLYNIHTEPFRPQGNSITVVTQSYLYDGHSEYTDDTVYFYVELYEYNGGNLTWVSDYLGKCDRIEGGVEFNVSRNTLYVLNIVEAYHSDDYILCGHGHVYGVESIEGGNNTGSNSTSGATNAMNKEPVKMHYYQEMYRDGNTYVLDYNLVFEQDSLGRITTVTNYDSNNRVQNSVTQQYDANGNCTRKYTLGYSQDCLYLDYEDDKWSNGGIVESSDGSYKRVYDNDAYGKHLTCDFYEDGRHYMHDAYTYDEEGRVYVIDRENYGGNWHVFIVHHYDYGGDKPSMLEWIYDDGTCEYMEYTYEYDNYARLITETENYYNADGLRGLTIKKYTY